MNQKTKMLLELAQNDELLFSLPREKLKTIMKHVRKVKERKYERRKNLKYKYLGYKTMSIEEANTFFSAFYPDEYREKAMFLTQAFLGLRIGEVVQIKLEDINFEQKQVRVKTEKQGPFEVIDSLYLHEPLEQLLLDYVTIYEKEIILHKGFLFFARTKRGVNPFINSGEARNIFRKVCNRAGMNEHYGLREPINKLKGFKPGKLHRYTTHSLRGAFAQFLRIQGVPAEIRSQLMRHKSRETLKFYDAPQKPEADNYLKNAFAGQKLVQSNF